MSIMDNRKLAMQWWEGISSLRKTIICDTNTDIIGEGRRWETLTGREIEQLFDEEMCNIEDDVFGNPANYKKNKGTQRSPFGL